jgi:hypothetical protein
VGWSRRGLFRRIRDELRDLQRARRQLKEVEADMAALLAGLGLGRPGDIPGLTLAGAAVILAETGDPRRYETSSSMVKHAGLSPSDNASGASEGASRISRRGRPSLRVAAWRATFAMLNWNPVMKAKYEALVAGAEESARATASSAPRLGPGRAGRPQRPRGPGEGPRRVRRVPAALDLLHDRARRRLGPGGRLRRPLRTPGGTTGCLTSANAPVTCGRR